MARLAGRGSLCTVLNVKDMWISSLTRSFGTVSAACSRYSNIYMEPTFRRDDVQQPIPEDDPRRFQPIKAARNEQVYSLNYDDLIQKFIRHITKEGKKDIAVRIVQNTIENIKLIQLEKYYKAKTEEERGYIDLDPKKIFYEAVDNCRPLLITQKVKRGGVIYQVPIPVKDNYQMFTAFKWLIESAREKDSSIRIWDKLANELLDAYKNQGKSIRKKQELHRLCETNRAYAHFRW